MGVIMVYKPTYNWGGPSCILQQANKYQHGNKLSGKLPFVATCYEHKQQGPLQYVTSGNWILLHIFCIFIVPIIELVKPVSIVWSLM